MTLNLVQPQGAGQGSDPLPAETSLFKTPSCPAVYLKPNDSSILSRGSRRQICEKVMGMESGSNGEPIEERLCGVPKWA